jgi:hypothetical protein
MDRLPPRRIPARSRERAFSMLYTLMTYGGLIEIYGFNLKSEATASSKSLPLESIYCDALSSQPSH